MLAILWLAAALGGGSARADVIAVLPLRLAAVVALFGCFWSVPIGRLSAPAALPAVGVVAVFVALQLVPLPPEWWSSLPGRGLYAQLNAVPGIGPVWRPISLAPDLTWNSLLALLPPTATMVCFAIVDGKWRRIALIALLITIILGALLGLLQLAGGPQSALRFYAVTNDDAATGFFANRNHQAVFLEMGIPLVIWWAISGPDQRHFVWKIAGAGLTIVFLYAAALATQSRMAFFLSPVAIVGGVLIYYRSALWRRPRRRTLLAIAAAGAMLLAGLIGVAVRMSDRLLAMAATDDVRVAALPDEFRAIQTYFPFGAGYGTFSRVFPRFESDRLLDPQYLNHAHSEPVNLLVEGGAVSVILIGVLSCWFVLRSWRIWFRPRFVADQSADMARTASALLLLPLLSSIADYPFRAPLMACSAAICVVLMRTTLPVGRQRRHSAPGSIGDGRSSRLSVGSNDPF